ncbi:MAG: hypothetical protein WCQ91_06235, partial [Planctomycetota bacterium]
MHSQATFTGRPRRRTTHPWVKAGDRLAQVLITLAGVGTIAAVLLVGLFLLAVAVPLFRPARIAMAGKASTQAVAIAADPQRLVSMGADDSGILAWFLEVGGTADAGTADRIRVFNSTDGTLLLERSAAQSGCHSASAIRILPGSLEGVVGYQNGSFRTGRIGLESKFLAATDLPAGLGALELGAAKVHDNGVILRGDNNRYARVELVTDLATEPGEPLGARVVDVDITRLSTGPLVAAIDEKGNVRVEVISSRRNLLTDQVVTTASGATIPSVSPASSLGRFVRVSELGDQLFVIAADGLARRYEIRSIESPTLMESFAAVPQGKGVVAVARLFGGNALAIADTAGNVQVWFATRAVDAESADGLQMVAAKTFPATKNQAAITAIAPSPRSRLFAVADASGGIRMLQSTNASTVLSLQSTAAGRLATPAGQLLIAPRENRLLAADAASICAWSFDAGYPEVSFRSLFSGVWYENYPVAVHAWETTGHESFESKFGLMPLIFGTLKATLYSMLFATPIAILAAIYSSQFMH